MILLIIIPVYISLNLYILHRVHKWLTACSERFHSRKFAVPYIVIYSLLALSLLFAFLLPSSELQILVKRISNYWLGTFAYILIFIAVADILRLVLKKIPGKIHDFFFSKVGYVFVGILLTALIGGISAYGIVHSNIVKVKPYEVTIRKNCGDNRDLKVVLVADLHLGYSVGNGQMQRMVKRLMIRMRIWWYLPGIFLIMNMKPCRTRTGSQRHWRELRADMVRLVCLAIMM